MKIKELRAKFADVCGDETRSGNRAWLIKRIAWRIQANHAGGLPPSVLPLDGSWPGLRFAGGQFIRKQWWLTGTADSQYLHFLIAYRYYHSVCIALAGSEKHLPQTPAPEREHREVSEHVSSL
jgi:hypothetical protein